MILFCLKFSLYNKRKIAKVITLYKKDSRDNPRNYRPISLPSVFSKLIEKIMNKRLYSFLDSCRILHTLQVGFRELNSTLLALIGMTETIKETIDKSMFGCGVYILIYRRHLIQSITQY